MSLSINTNTSAIAAARVLARSQTVLHNAIGKLASGSRINSAADDIAGSAVASRQLCQIQGLNMSLRNASDAMSLLQTADGAYQEIDSILQRMKGLAVQAANGAYSSEDLANLNAEHQQLLAEIDRISGSTMFNGMHITETRYTFMYPNRYTQGQFKFQIGTQGNDYINVALDSTVTYDARTFDSGWSGAASWTLTAKNTTNGTITLTAQNPTDLDDLIAKLKQNAGYDPNIFKVSKSQGAPEQNAAFGVLTITSSNQPNLVATKFADDQVTISNGQFTYVGSSYAGKLSMVGNTSLSSNALAQNAMTKIDSAIDALAETRSRIGAQLNRLEFTSSVLGHEMEATIAARSRIMDTDYASATAQLAAGQIISQAATAILAQANQSPMYVLALLK